VEADRLRNEVANNPHRTHARDARQAQLWS
jgi:hypothetical protein